MLDLFVSLGLLRPISWTPAQRVPLCYEEDVRQVRRQEKLPLLRFVQSGDGLLRSDSHESVTVSGITPSLAGLPFQVLHQSLKRRLVRVVVLPVAEVGDEVLAYLAGRARKTANARPVIRPTELLFPLSSPAAPPRPPPSAPGVSRAAGSFLELGLEDDWPCDGATLQADLRAI